LWIRRDGMESFISESAGIEKLSWPLSPAPLADIREESKGSLTRPCPIFSPKIRPSRLPKMFHAFLKGASQETSPIPSRDTNFE